MIGLVGGGGATGPDVSRRVWTGGVGVVLGKVEVTINPEFWATPEDDGRGGMELVGAGGVGGGVIPGGLGLELV